LNSLGLGNSPDFELLESRVERVGDTEVKLTHVFRYKPLNLTLQLEPFTNYS
jgi:hypothetical protein